jgi:oxygen-independent coproporphyrinogen III oxidase
MKTGLYLHIPFCRKACHYCDFHFSTVQRREPVLRAMVAELQHRAPKGAVLETIYWGGGTPSILDPHEMEFLWKAIQEHYTWTASAEITLEANPDDLKPEQLAFWKSLGFNRLSVGIQSFHQKDLEAMNRAHNSTQALQTIPMLRAAGFENFSIDLMYGLPNSTPADWAANLKIALDAEVPHLSAYALTIEPKTALAHQVKTGLVKPLADSAYAAHYDALLQSTAAAGMVPYEISNFCLPGKEAVHNGHYWDGAAYIGIGPGAHSFDGQTRSWNIANNTRYAKTILERKEWPTTAELLTQQDRYNEYLMTGLRTLKGIDPQWVAKNFPGKIATAFTAEAQKLLAAQHLAINTEARYYIPLHQRMQTDAITRNLFVVD